MDYDKLADAITERTKVIVPVDVAVICADVDKVREIVSRPEILAKFHPANDIQKLLGRIAISNDCAHSFGASRHGKMAGEIADFSSFSFHAVKNFTTAEGGALTWNLPFGNEKVERQQVYCGSPVPFIEGETWNEFIYRLSQLFSLHGQNKDALAKNEARRMGVRYHWPMVQMQHDRHHGGSWSSPVRALSVNAGEASRDGFIVQCRH